MDAESPNGFGKRRPDLLPPAQPGPPEKRSRHVALLLMGTLAVGGSAYAVMPREDCRPTSPSMAAPAVPPLGVDCARRNSSSGSGSSGGGGSSRSNFFNGDPSSSGGSSSSSTSSGSVSRGGFGWFARAFGFGGG